MEISINRLFSALYNLKLRHLATGQRQRIIMGTRSDVQQSVQPNSYYTMSVQLENEDMI